MIKSSEVLLQQKIWFVKSNSSLALHMVCQQLSSVYGPGSARIHRRSGKLVPIVLRPNSCPLHRNGSIPV